MAAINSRLYRNTLELLRLYNSSTSFRNVFNRLLNRPRVYYKGIPLKTYVYTLTSLNHQYFYRFLKITPERINRLFTNFYINTGSRQALERSVTQYPLTENEILEHNELAGIEKLPEDEKKENFFDKFLEKNSQGEKTDEKKEEVKQPESQPQSTRATQFRQNLAARLKTFQTPNIIKNISSKGQIGARKLLSKLTPTQLASLGLGLTGGLLGLISNGSAGALIGGAAGAITPTLINKGYGQLAVQTAYVVGIRTSRALNSLNNIKLGLPGLTLAFKNPLLIVAIGAGLLLFILMPEGLLESSALLPSYTSLSGTGSGSGSSATGNLTITKTGPAAVNNGENITYQISVTYSGTGTADIEITDKLPPGTDFLSASDGGQNQSGTVKWTLAGVSSAQKTITLIVKTTQPDIYVTNTATATVKNTSGGGSSVGIALFPNPVPVAASNWDTVKPAILAATNNPTNVNIYKQASATTGVPWEVLAGIHYREGGSGTNTSLVSGRQIRDVEPDVRYPDLCPAANQPGQGKAIFIARDRNGRTGCGFANVLDSAIYAGNLLKEKNHSQVPQAYQELVTALSRYNGGGNRNCNDILGASPRTSYTGCPRLFEGEDDAYVLAKFDQKHDLMYLVYCGDLILCSPPRTFPGYGVLTAVRAILNL